MVATEPIRISRWAINSGTHFISIFRGLIGRKATTGWARESGPMKCHCDVIQESIDGLRLRFLLIRRGQQKVTSYCYYTTWICIILSLAALQLRLSMDRDDLCDVQWFWILTSVWMIRKNQPGAKEPCEGARTAWLRPRHHLQVFGRRSIVKWRQAAAPGSMSTGPH